MPIYTRTGDTGTTSLANGKRVSKSSLEIEIGGCLDELSAFLGLARAAQVDNNVKSLLLDIQRSLLKLGGDVALGVANFSNVADADTKQFEQLIDLYSKSLPVLREFIIPGDNHASATLHVARTVCRRTERVFVQFNETRTAELQTPLSPAVLRYVNRLSDLLFVLARVASGNAEDDTAESVTE